MHVHLMVSFAFLIGIGKTFVGALGSVGRPGRLGKKYLLLMCERLLVGGLGSPKSVMEPDWASGARIGSVLDAFWDFLVTFSGRRNKLWGVYIYCAAFPSALCWSVIAPPKLCLYRCGLQSFLEKPMPPK